MNNTMRGDWGESIHVHMKKVYMCTYVDLHEWAMYVFFFPFLFYSFLNLFFLFPSLSLQSPFPLTSPHAVLHTPLPSLISIPIFTPHFPSSYILPSFLHSSYPSFPSISTPSHIRISPLISPHTSSFTPYCRKSHPWKLYPPSPPLTSPHFPSLDDGEKADRNRI